MDKRSKCINEILSSIQESVDDVQYQKIKDTLYLKLDNYEITDRCTAVGFHNDSYEAVVNMFLETKKLEGKSDGTIFQYELRCLDMLKIINKPIKEIQSYDVRYYLSYCKEKRNVSNRTLSNIRSCLCVFFTWLYDEGMIPNNPMDSIETIKYTEEVRYPFSDIEMEKLRRACSNKRDRAIVEFLYATGCRVSEIVSLNRNDIDWNSKKVTVLGKGNKKRTVYIDDIALLYLQEYLNSRQDSDECLFRCIKGSKNARLSVDGVESMLHDLGDKAGVKDVHPHRFRRTFATKMLNHGAPIQNVAKMLGHSSIDTTMIYYYADQSVIADTYNKYAS